MAHDNNGRIYIDTNSTPNKGVEIADLQAVLGLSNNDIGALIHNGATMGRINKWAKYKPIHYPGKFKLDDADFRGRNTDYNDFGLVFGLKVPSQISVINPSAFHATSWDYLGFPNATGLPGTSMYRLLDFDGYSANARANIYGIIPSTSKFYINTTVAICSLYSAIEEGFIVNNTSGVDLARFVVDLDPDDDDSVLMQRLTRCYPAILIGNYLTGVGVYNTTSGQLDYSTIVKSNGSGGYVVSSPQWCVDMNKLDGSGNAPWSSNTNAVATLVLVYTGNSNPYLVNGDPTSDLTQYWLDMTEERAWTARIFPLPGACGVPIAITKYGAGYTMTPVRVTATTTSVTVYMSVSFEGTESVIGHGTVNARIGSGGTSGTRDVLRLTPSTTEVHVTFDDLDNDFGIQMLMPNTDYTITIDTTAYPPTSGNTAHGEITFRVS